MSGYPPMSGGYAPAVNVWTVIRENERIAPLDVPGKITGFPLKRDDIVEIRSMGGGGYGDPLTREVELVKQDVWNGYTTEERAQQMYGVAIVNGEVDSIKTKKGDENVWRDNG